MRVGRSFQGVASAVVIATVLVGGWPPAAAASPDAPAVGASRTAVAPTGDDSDRSVERFLTEGTVVSIEDIGTGVTRPERVTLEWNGRTMRAAFKTAHITRFGITRFARGRPERNFTDSYHYERAAFLLDRQLGLGMVPVTVIREIDGREGALIRWVDDAESEAARRERGAKSSAELHRQLKLMKLFDALILNTDRNLSNQLITGGGARLHLIDHSRSFRQDKRLPPSFLAEPAELSRALHERLGALTFEGLWGALRGTLSKGQVRALLARRDRLLEKVAADRERFGDGLVLRDPGPSK